MKSNLENVITAAEAGTDGEWSQGRFSRHVLAIKDGAPRFIKEEARKSGPHLAGNTAGHGAPVWP